MNTLKRIEALRGACHKALHNAPIDPQSKFDQQAFNTLLVIEQELYLIKLEIKKTIKETDILETG